MKTNAATILTIFVLSGILMSQSGFAKDKVNPSPKQQSDHSQMMMGKMDHTQMKGMMKECMDSHKDGKMCEKDAMTKCQMSMNMGDCQKMMEESKKSEKH